MNHRAVPRHLVSRVRAHGVTRDDNPLALDLTCRTRAVTSCEAVTRSPRQQSAYRARLRGTVHAPGQGNGEPHGTGLGDGCCCVGGVEGTACGVSGRQGGIGMMRPSGGSGVGAGVTLCGGGGSGEVEALARGDAPPWWTAS